MYFPPPSTISTGLYLLTNLFLLTYRATRNSITYIAEGNIHVVFQLNDKDVLRISKQSQSDAITTTRTATRTTTDSTAFTTSQCIQHVWTHLLGVQYINIPRPITISSSTIVKLNNILFQLEKSSERDKKRLGSRITSTDGHLLNNAFVFSHSIEIKPKCGCLPSATVISPNSPKHHISRYQMHQHLKLYNNEIQSISQYSPLDFFSGNDRLRRKSLLQLSNTPQNNFRYFIHGIQSKATATSPLIVDIIGDILLREDKLLNSILAVQKMDTLDFEQIDPVMPPDANEKEVLHSYLKNGNTCQKLNSYQKFLLARTAMDCSIIISFQRHNENDSNVTKKESLQDINQYGTFYHGHQCYIYHICVVDLDLKNISKMKKWIALDKDIVECYTRHANTKVTST